MTCRALNGIKLCGRCVEDRAQALCQDAYNSGHWHSLSEDPHGSQILESVAANNLMVVDRETRSCTHAYTVDLVEAAKCISVSTENWPLTKIEFARTHCGKHNMWFHPKEKWLRRTTPLRLYDKSSILTKMNEAPQKGLNITDIVKEYPEAFNDVTSLVDSGKLLVYKETAWLRQPLNTSR